MTRVQILVLVILAMFVCVVFGIAAVVVRAQLLTPPDANLAQRPAEETVTPGPTPTWTIMPTNTFTPTPAETPTPSPTSTRVVLDTPTPTPSSTPTVTSTPTATGTPTPARGGGSSRGSGGGGPRPTPAPTSRYPLKIVGEPLEYETKNYIFVVYARITNGNTLLPGYRMVGTHYPSGAHVESPPSCTYLCKGSGPKKEDWLIQESNLAFEAFFYDTGTWSLVLLDPQGHQASEAIEIKIDIKERKWFYYQFSQ